MTASTEKKAAKPRKKAIAAKGPAVEVLSGPRVEPKREILNIGVIGYGYWGPNLVRNFAETPGAKVAAVADFDTTKLALVERRHV